MVIASSSPQKARRCADSARAALGPGEHETLTVGGAQPTPEALNEGMARASGDAVVFCRDDVEFVGPVMAGVLAERLSVYDVVGVAGTARLVSPAWIDAGPPWVYGQWVTPLKNESLWRLTILGGAPRVAGGMQALDGMLIAARRSAAERLRFDAARFPTALWDVDYTFSAHRAGLRLAVCAEIGVVYRPAEVSPDLWRRSAPAFVAKHGKAMPKGAARAFRVGHADFASREEALAAMAPPHWARGDE